MSDAVHNARVQLLANLLNMMAGSSFTVGVAAPVAASLFYGVNQFALATGLIGVVFWLGMSTVLHVFAQRVLGSMRL